MSARILAGSIVLAFVLVALCLFGSVALSPASGQLAGRPGSEQGLVFNPWEPTTVEARIIFSPEIASRLQLLDGGRRVQVEGHVTCPEGDTFTIRTVVSQDSIGVQAEGRVQGVCTGDFRQVWTAVARVQGPTPLEEGNATACGWADVSTYNGTYHWCVRTHLYD
jgi:hypothetical protein